MSNLTNHGLRAKGTLLKDIKILWKGVDLTLTERNKVRTKNKKPRISNLLLETEGKIKLVKNCENSAKLGSQ